MHECTWVYTYINRRKKLKQNNHKNKPYLTTHSTKSCLLGLQAPGVPTSRTNCTCMPLFCHLVSFAIVSLWIRVLLSSVHSHINRLRDDHLEL